jgi:glycosyltransferase involved in cell wall biosynthesis
MGVTEGLWKQGHDVEVYTAAVSPVGTAQLPKRTDPDFDPYPIRVNRLAGVILGSKLGSKIVFPGLILKLLKEKNPDVIHTYVMGTFSVFATGWLKKVKGYPLVVTADFDVAGPLPSLIKIPYVHFYIKLPVSFADIIIAFTKEQKDELIRRFNFDEEKIKVVPIGIEFEKFASASGSELRKGLGLENKFVILTISFITPKKNIELALRSIKRTPDNVVFVHIGGVLDEQYKKKLDDTVKELGLEKKVKFLGPISLEQIPDYYKIADVFLQTGFRESFCIPILEAMASGLPVITTKVGIASEVIEDEKTGFIVKDEDEIADRLRFLMENQDMRMQMGQRNIQVSKNYDWKPLVEAIARIYSNIKK